MPRFLVWTIDSTFQGWACSDCTWKYPVPELLTDLDARSAYDRLAAANFKEHTCADAYADRKNSSRYYEETIAERSRKLIKQGIKLKDAVDLALQEVALECGDDTRTLEHARADAREFLKRVHDGLL